MASMQKPSQPCNGPRTPPEHQGIRLSASSELLVWSLLWMATKSGAVCLLLTSTDLRRAAI